MKYKPSSFNKICRVCGDRATAYNFGGLSCDSCKIFFRRNGPNAKKLECCFSERCEISLSTRKYCSRCRLRKCFAIGMELRWLERRKIKSIIDQSDHFMNSIQTTSNQKTDTSLRNILQMDISSDEGDSIKCGQFSVVVKEIIELTTSEWKYITEIQNAIQVFEDENTLPVIGCAQNLSHGQSYVGLYARRIIKFCKHFPTFRSLNREDQFTVLKPFYMEIFSIRFAFHQKHNTEGVRLIENETGDQAILVSYDLYPKFEGADQCGLFMDSMQREMENDEIIRNLLIAQFLFSPRENLHNFEIISYQYHSYHYLLRRYLHHKYKNTFKADKKYSLLMYLINKYYPQMKEDILRMYAKFVDFKQAGQVMTELYCPK